SLAGVPVRVFVEQYYLKLPFSRPGGCLHLAGRAGWPLVEALLRTPGADFLAARPDGVRPGTAAPSPEEARALLAAGHTLRFRHAERHDALLAELAEGFRRAFLGAL